MQQAVSSAKVTVHILRETGWHEEPLDDAPISALLDDHSSYGRTDDTRTLTGNHSTVPIVASRRWPSTPSLGESRLERGVVA